MNMSAAGKTARSLVSLLVALGVGFVGGVVVGRSSEPSHRPIASSVANSDEVGSPGQGRTPSPEPAPSQDPANPSEIRTSFLLEDASPR